jgi:hypothetical protein
MIAPHGHPVTYLIYSSLPWHWKTPSSRISTTNLRALHSTCISAVSSGMWHGHAKAYLHILIELDPCTYVHVDNPLLPVTAYRLDLLRICRRIYASINDQLDRDLTIVWAKNRRLRANASVHILIDFRVQPDSHIRNFCGCSGVCHLVGPLKQGLGRKILFR